MKFAYDVKLEGEHWQTFEAESAFSAAMKLVKPGYQLLPGELSYNGSAYKTYFYTAQNGINGYRIWVNSYV